MGVACGSLVRLDPRVWVTAHADARWGIRHHATCATSAGVGRRVRTGYRSLVTTTDAADHFVRVRGASEHNLRDVDVDIPRYDLSGQRSALGVLDPPECDEDHVNQCPDPEAAEGEKLCQP